MDDSSKYVQSFKDRKVKVTRSGLYAIRTPIELVDSGTAICMGKILKMKHFNFDSVKSDIENKKLLDCLDPDGYVDDMTDSVYRIDPKFNYVTVRLVGDTYGEQCNKNRKKSYTEDDKQKLVEEFLAKREGRRV